jgi:hypothetical protein
MQDLGYELPRIPIPRTPVNRGKKKGRGQEIPNPSHPTTNRLSFARQRCTHSQALRAPERLEGIWIAHRRGEEPDPRRSRSYMWE